MKTKIFLLATTLFFFLGGIANAQKKENKKETVKFEVSMTCESCKKRIERTIAFEKGVTDMHVNLPTKTVEIEYKKEKTSIEKLQAAFEKLGYTAIPLEKQENSKDKE